MSMTLDHYISFKYESSIGRVGRELRSDPSNTSPGWYLRAYRDEGYTDIVKYTYISPEAMLDIAKYIEDRLADDGILANLANPIQAANIEHSNRRKQAIQVLEKRIAADQEALLRARAEEYGDADE